MSFVDKEKFGVSAPLKAALFDFPRAKVLREAFVDCVTDYYTKATIGGQEARGLIITGHSRVGKTREVKTLIDDFNASATSMPDGRPGKIVSCLLSGRVTWKNLGIETLEALDYEINNSRTQSYIWRMVLEQAKRQGVIGIHYDECQHVFSDGSKSNRYFLDSFKSIMKEPRWPLMLMLSGVPTLTNFVQPYEQLSSLLQPVHFEEIHFKRDMELLNRLLFAFADKADVDIEDLSTPDFLERLDLACSHRWGLVIELMIEVLIFCRMQDKKQLVVGDFVKVYAARTTTSEKRSPFTAPDFKELFDPDKLLKLMTKE